MRPSSHFRPYWPDQTKREGGAGVIILTPYNGSQSTIRSETG
jgi:hypothetical protein